MLRSVKTRTKQTEAPLYLFLRHPLTIAAFGFVLTGVVGTFIAAYSAAITKDVEIARQRTLERKLAIQGFSREIYERRTRSEMLASAIRRRSADELKERKRLYDETYVKWNSNSQTNLFIVRDTTNDSGYSFIESAVEFGLIRNFLGPLDYCLTSSYDAFVGGDAKPSDQDKAILILDQCASREKLVGALNCGYAITDGLYQLVSSSVANRSQIETEVALKCRLRRAEDLRQGVNRAVR